MSFGVGSGESNWGGGVLWELLGRAAEGLGVVLPKPDEQWSGIAVYADAGLEEIKEQAPCIEFRPWALAHEREPLGAVELAWCRKLDRTHMPPMNRFPRVHALLAAAYAQPVLRQLMPVTSHFNLWFSTSTTARWETTRVGYMIWPHDEGFYGIRNGSELLTRFETPEEAVAFVVAVLPEGIEPARYSVVRAVVAAITFVAAFGCTCRQRS